jgi:DNA-binding response OmpR family regulator
MGSVSGLSGLSILVVEDQPLIALQMEALFQHAGAKVRCASGVREGMRLADQEPLSAAVLDYGLGNEDVSVLCRHLVGRRVPFMFYSGYPQPNEHPEAIFVPKPATNAALLTAMATLMRRAGNPA